MATKGVPFFGGMPTEMDVKALRDAYPAASLVVGRVIPYEEAARVIKTQKGSFRFKGVTNVWRGQLFRQEGIVMGVQPAVGFEVKSDGQKVGMAEQKNRSAVRMARRGFKISALVNVSNLSEDEKKTHGHNMARAGALIASAQIKALPGPSEL